MLSPQKHTEKTNITRKNISRAITFVSIAALIVSNVAPEFTSTISTLANQITAQQTLNPPTTNYIYVDTDGNGTGDSSDCQVWNPSSPYPINPTDCTLPKAIARANAYTDSSLTIVISESLAKISLTSNPPAIARNSTEPLVIEGEQPANKKTIIIDGSAIGEEYPHEELDYVFRIGTSSPSIGQNITIRNFAFSQLRKENAVAITTDDPLTPITFGIDPNTGINITGGIETGNFNELNISHNYFGTPDGTNMIDGATGDTFIFAGIRIAINDTSNPQTDENANTEANLEIDNNNFYNVINPLSLVSHHGTNGVNNNCSTNTSNAAINISSNIIGMDKDKNINDTFANKGAWSANAIAICNLSNIHIDRNIIANSTGIYSNTLDTGIYLKNTQAVITSTSIGPNAHPNTSAAIYGNGIVLEGNHSDESPNLIYNNTIYNLKTTKDQSEDFCVNGFNGRYNPTIATGRACGGTGIIVRHSSSNYIFDNRIGHIGDNLTESALSNEGYGIEINGYNNLTGWTGIDTQLKVSEKNKIAGNTIIGNKADGILIDKIDESNTSNCLPAPNNSRDNCQNSIIQNTIIRNGAYISTSSAGGIGIDLKVFEDTSEQWGGSSFYTGSGTTNDSDITFNDSGDTDMGGNGAINYPLVSDSPESTVNEIKGNLSESVNGHYWVEVFAVMCPSNRTPPLPTITAENAHQICDTDYIETSANDRTQTHGQGAAFLCGAYVHKTNTNNTWSCKPGDFGKRFTGGLVTTTVTTVRLPTEILTYEPIEPDTQVLDLKYSCNLFSLFFTGASIASICPTDTDGPTSPEALIDNGTIITHLGSTSEFSQNAFIANSAFSIEKMVRLCDTANSSSCDTFSREVDAPPGQYIEFRIAVKNESSANVPFVKIEDILPTNLTWISGTCRYFNNLSTIPEARPTANGTNCNTTNIPTLTIEPTTPTNINANSNLVVYALAQVSSSAPRATNIINRANVESASCDTNLLACISRATVHVIDGPVGIIEKSILTPNNDANLKTETVASSTSLRDINYQIRLTLRGTHKAAVTSAIITDTFPRTLRDGVNMEYSNCAYTIAITGGDTAIQNSNGNCTNATSINTTASTPLAIWNGSLLPDAFDTNHTAVVTITYTGRVPANALRSTDSNVVLTNVARWSANDTTDQTTLTITPATPTTTQNSVTLTKTVTPAEITMSSVPQTVTYTIRLVKTGTESMSDIVWQDSFPTASSTGTPLNVTYSNCQVTIAPAGSSTFPCNSPFPHTTKRLSSGSNIGANTTSITYTYTATIPPATITSNQLLTNSTYFLGTFATGAKPEITREATLTIRPATTQTGTATPSFTKRANNNVTSASRRTETVYKPGDTVNYTISVSNSGTASAAQVSLTDILPGNLTSPTIGTATGGITATIAGRTITIPAFTLATGTNSASIIYSATLASKRNFDLSDADMDTDADEDDDEFFIASGSDIETDISSRNNSYRREKDVIGAPDGKALSLGKEGSVIIDLGDKLVVNGASTDFGVTVLTNSTSGNDTSTSSYQVAVSQDNTTFTDIGDDNTGSEVFDLRKANLPWIRFIQITDTSRSVAGVAPGTDIDAVCLFNIGVEEINQATLVYNTTTLRMSAPIVVDVTSTFDNEPDPDNCKSPDVTAANTEIPPLPVAPPTEIAKPSAAPLPTPAPPSLPTTGASVLAILTGISAGVYIKRVWRKK